LSVGGHGGPVFHEIRHVLYDASTKPYIVNYIYGLGGRDISPNQIHGIYEDLQKIVRTQQVETPIKYVGLKE